MAQDITLQQAQQNPLLNSILAPYFQPGATLGQTEQSTQTSGAEAANLQASNPGIQAQSSTQQVENLQKKAQLGLSADLTQNKMTLPTAIKKYTALGMKSDDVFKQYLAESPYGLPNQSPTELQNMGVSPDAIGKIGDNGSFADRWNTKQALLGMRDLKDKWNTVNGLSKLGIFGLGVSTPSGQGYSAQRQFLGQHLSSLIPGAPGGQGPAGALIDQIPDVNHITESEPGAAEQRFSGAETGLLNVKGYSYKDLGLPNPSDSGQDLMSTLKQRPNMKGGELLQNILNDTKSIGTNTVNSGSQYLNKILSGENPSTATGDMAIQAGKGELQTLGGILGIQNKNGKLSENPNAALDYITKHPVTTAMQALPFLAGRGEAATNIGETTAETPKAPPIETASKTTSQMPSKLSTILNAPKARATLGTQRDSLVTQAEKGGSTVNGNSVVDDMNKWRETAKDANPGKTNAAKIDDIADGVVDRYHNQKLPPTKALTTYHEVDSGFTRSGATKETIQGSADQALRDSLEKNLDDAAPGFSKYTRELGKNYQTEKGQPAKIIKNLPYNAAKAALNAGGLGFLREIIGG